MAFNLSTGLRNAIIGNEATPDTLMTATTISFGDGTGTGGNDEILDSGNGLGSFVVGDYITVAGSTSNNVTAKILAVAAGSVEVAAATLSTEAAGDQVVLASCSGGGSFAELFRNCVVRIYSGGQPSDADQAETGTLLLTLTESGGTFTAGNAANGLNFDGDAAAAGVLAKESSETWQGDGVAAGTAGYFRCYANAYTTGASTTAVRFDGTCGTSGAQMIMSSTTISVSATTTVDTCTITQPAA